MCKGAGFVHPYVGGKVVYRQAIPCREPGCLAGIIQNGVRGEARDQTFLNFEPQTGAKKALNAAHELAFGRSEFVWLLLYGGPGCGKTHLCNAMIKEVRERGWEAKLIMAADLFSMLRQAISENRTDEVLTKLKELFFLVIDDYGVEYGSNWEEAKFDELMTSRYSRGLPTVVTTNKDFEALPDRIKSRFKDKRMSQAVYNSAPDYRGRR